MTPERLFLDQLGVIDQVVQFIARRHHLHADEADDLAGADGGPGSPVIS